jgi:hypothetical protein
LLINRSTTYTRRQLADNVQLGDWVRLPMASVTYANAPDGVGYWRVNMHGSNPKPGEKLPDDHPAVLKRKRCGATPACIAVLNAGNGRQSSSTLWCVKSAGVLVQPFAGT